MDIENIQESKYYVMCSTKKLSNRPVHYVQGGGEESGKPKIPIVLLPQKISSPDPIFQLTQHCVQLDTIVQRHKKFMHHKCSKSRPFLSIFFKENFKFKCLRVMF